MFFRQFCPFFISSQSNFYALPDSGQQNRITAFVRLGHFLSYENNQSCQVCHVQEQEGVAPTRFGWVDIANGQLCANPNMAEGVWGEYGAKIVPLKGGAENLEPATLDEEETFAAKFRKQVDDLDDRQKVVRNKFIHRRCIDAPVRCADCHNSEKAFLPYMALGYSSERSEFLVSTEVADLVARYETFYIPNLLRTDELSQEQTREDSQ